VTIRARLTVWYASTLAALMLAYGAFVYFAVERRLWEQLDQEIHADYERAETTLSYAKTEGGAYWRPGFGSQGSPGHDEPAPIVHVLGADGRTIHRSPGFADDGSLRIRSWPHEVKADSPGAGAETVTIRAASPVAGVRAELRALLLVLALGVPLGIGAAALGGYLLARRALAPVAEMAEGARRITAERLADRLPVENPSDEIGRLATVFNDTLARLEQSFDRLRRFTADASHELRTPLTAMRTVGEVGLREPRDPAAYREVIGSMLEEADRLARLVESLLALSRADAGQVRLVLAPFDLGDLGREVGSHLSVLAEEKGQTLAVDAPTPVPLTADRQVLRLAVVNLIDNAVKHGPEMSVVRVQVAERDGSAVLEVADAGPGIPPEHRTRLFDRFYRVDEARSRATGGAGLGLAIARWAVEAHGGRLELESEVGKGSRFRIVLPRGGATRGGGS
jgi:heavy metal sensor kinase